MSFYTFLPRLLNMSFTASVAIIFVILVRLALKKAPKWISYALWGIVLFRLLCPTSLTSELSVFRFLNIPTTENHSLLSDYRDFISSEDGIIVNSLEYIPSDIVRAEFPAVVLPVPGLSEFINQKLPSGREQLAADPLEAPVSLATYIWMLGVLGMIIYAVISYIHLRKKLVISSLLHENIYLSDGIDTPFVMGLFRPKIYLPSFIQDKELDYIIQHEKCHIQRLDHLWKFLGFIALSIHWFNPLVWYAFHLASKDMEMSCDEMVLRKMGSDILPDYSASLLNFAADRHRIARMPIGFGEGDIKARIYNLVNWKKPGTMFTFLVGAVCAILAICLLSNPGNSDGKIIIGEGSEPVILGTGFFEEYSIFLQMYEGYYDVDLEPGPFWGPSWVGKCELVILNRYDDTVLSRFDLKDWKEPMLFQEQVTLNVVDYNEDGVFELLLGQYGTQNFNLYHLYQIYEEQEIGNESTANPIVITYRSDKGDIAMTCKELSPILEYDGKDLQYEVYDNTLSKKIYKKLQFVERSLPFDRLYEEHPELINKRK